MKKQRIKVLAQVAKSSWAGHQGRSKDLVSLRTVEGNGNVREFLTESGFKPGDVVEIKLVERPRD